MDVCLSPISSSHNNEVDFESDNISVTESPKLNTDEEHDKSISHISGAFTSLHTRGASLKKGDLFSGLAPQFQNHANFNPALTAQLFLQNPLLPQPSQWLYNQLYGGYNDFHWFRTISKSGSMLEKESNNINLVKKTIRLIPIEKSDNREDTITKRTSTPEEIDESTNTDGLGPIRNTTPKHVDVWRPY